MLIWSKRPAFDFGFASCRSSAKTSSLMSSPSFAAIEGRRQKIDSGYSAAIPGHHTFLYKINAQTLHASRRKMLNVAVYPLFRTTVVSSADSFCVHLNYASPELCGLGPEAKRPHLRPTEGSGGFPHGRLAAIAEPLFAICTGRRRVITRIQNIS